MISSFVADIGNVTRTSLASPVSDLLMICFAWLSDKFSSKQIESSVYLHTLKDASFFGATSGVLAWREAPCSAWRSHAFARGFRACSPEKIFKNGAIWCVLESILLKFCQKNNLKKVIFYIKITDNVLLRTIFRGIAAYTPQISCHLCDLACFGVLFP